MDRDGCVEVRIEPSRKVSAVNSLRASSTRTLSKLRENARITVDNHLKVTNPRQSPGVKKLWPRVQSFTDRSDCRNYPLDIELLLRLYACNSSMEKSIRRVIEEAEERNFATTAERYAKSLSSNLPSIELGAAYRLIHFLKESCCKNPSPSTPSYCEILLALRKLVADCNDNRLKNFLLHDPSLTMCERCGVISCAKPLDFTHHQYHSHERPYFLKGAGCSRTANPNDLVRAYRKIKISRSEREQGAKLFAAEKVLDVTETVNKDNQNTVGNASSVTEETVIPEKEISTRMYKIVEVHIPNKSSYTNKNIQSHQTDNQVPKNILTPAMDKINSNGKYKVNPNPGEFTDNSKRGQNHVQPTHNKHPEKCKIGSIPRRDERKLFSAAHSRIPLSESRCERSGSSSVWKARLPNTREAIDDGPNNGSQSGTITSDNVGAIVDRARYLARGPFTAASTNEREPVSQYSDATSRRSRNIARSQGFVLHGSRDDIPQIDADFPLRERADSLLHALRRAEERARVPMDRNDCGRKLSSSAGGVGLKRQSKSDSLTWSVENDSLENCSALPEVRVLSESDTTGFSSSSAENLMKDWLSRLAPKENDTRDREASDSTRSITPDASSNILADVAAKIARFHEAATNDARKASFARIGSKNNVNESSPSKDNTKLIPPIEEKDESEEPAAPQDPQKALATPGDVLQNKNNLIDVLSNKSSHRASNTYVSVHSSRRAIAMEMLSFYQKIFEETQQMDWESFQAFVEHVHPGQKELWRNICGAIANEARRAADEESVNTEVCIEITPVDRSSVERETSTNEIVFEMDITFADIETFLDKGSTAKEGV